jgi:hypothetical protein
MVGSPLEVRLAQRPSFALVKAQYITIEAGGSLDIGHFKGVMPQPKNLQYVVLPHKPIHGIRTLRIPNKQASLGENLSGALRAGRDDKRGRVLKQPPLPL